jgi:putative peptide zinc metalloprotease protein
VDDDLPEQTRLRFVPLVSRREGSEWILGRAPAGPFIAVPHIGVVAIELLADGHTLGDTERELGRRYGESVDVRGFVHTLSRLGLVADQPSQPDRPRRAPGISLPWLRDRHVRWLVGGPFAVIWSGLIGAAAAALVAYPRSRPGLRDLVWAHSAAVVLVGDLAVVSAAIFIHELAHLAVARAYAVPGTITLSTRLTVVVAQTDVTGVWLLPRRRRLLVYLAGIAADLALAALCILATLALDPGGVTATALRATVVTLGSGIIIQFALHLRTDIYFVLQDVARCRNLNADAMRVIRYRARRLCRHTNLTDPRRALPTHERRMVTAYAPLLAVGSLATLTYFATVSVPFVVRLLAGSVTQVEHGIGAHRMSELANGAAGLLVLAVWDGILLISLARKGIRVLRHRRQHTAVDAR